MPVFIPHLEGDREMEVATKKVEKLRKERIPSGTAYIADRPITLDEFCDLFGEDDDVELIDGVVVERMATQFPHENLFRFLFSLLVFYADNHSLGIVLGSRTLVSITPYKGRLPDILFVCKEREHIIGQKRLTGAPDLVVEIISPSDTAVDTMQRQSNYEQIGVRELWIVDQPHKQFRAFSLDEVTKTFIPIELEGDIFHSNVVTGFWLKADWLWQEPLPSVVKVWKELEGVL